MKGMKWEIQFFTVIAQNLTAFVHGFYPIRWFFTRIFFKWQSKPNLYIFLKMIFNFSLVFTCLKRLKFFILLQRNFKKEVGTTKNVFFYFVFIMFFFIIIIFFLHQCLTDTGALIISYLHLFLNLIGFLHKLPFLWVDKTKNNI